MRSGCAPGAWRAGSHKFSTPAPTLIIWTTPPGPAELRAILEQVAPQKIILFAVDPPASTLEGFLTHLAGLVKHALNVDQGTIRYVKLAAAAAHREETVRLGLRWLQANGNLRIQEQLLDGVGLAPGSGGKSAELPSLGNPTYKRFSMKLPPTGSTSPEHAADALVNPT